MTGTRAGEATRHRPAWARHRPAWAGPLVLAVTACLLGPSLAAGCATRQRADWTAGVPSEQIGQSGAPLSPGTPIAVLAPPAGDALVTNEYATYSSDSAAAVSPDWTANSGSLFARDGAFWSGVPDSCQPDQQSSRCTNSNVFRMNSRRAFGGPITVGIAVRQNRNLANPRCEAAHTCWHGVHLWLRFRSETNLYYISLQRADQKVIVKRKVPCGPDNDGTYFELTRYVPRGFTTGQWRRYAVRIETQPDGTVRIRLFDLDVDPARAVVTGIDRGGVNPNWSASCAVAGAYPSARYQPIREAGSLGVRGDFSDFSFGPVTVSG